MPATWPLWFCLFSAIDVNLTPTDGADRHGTLRGFTAETVAIERDGKLEEVPTEQLRRVGFSHPSTPARDGAIVELTDGCTFSTKQWNQTGEQVSIQVDDFPELKQLDRRSVRSVLLQRNLDDTNLAQWREWSTRPPTADVVVLQRRDKQLQSIDGVIEGIDDAAVHFRFEGEISDVKRTRIVGLIYFHGTQPVTMASRAKLVTTRNSVIPLSSVTLTDEHVLVKSPGSTQFKIPLSDIQYVDFAATSTAYLSDLEPEQATYATYVTVRSQRDLDAQWFQWQRDRQLSRIELRTLLPNGTWQGVAKGLAVHSQTELTYRLAGEYRSFLATANLAEDLHGDANVVILLDGNEQSRVYLTSDAGGAPLQIDVTGVNRLTLRVEYGGQGDWGDHVLFNDARLLK